MSTDPHEAPASQVPARSRHGVHQRLVLRKLRIALIAGEGDLDVLVSRRFAIVPKRGNLPCHADRRRDREEGDERGGQREPGPTSTHSPVLSLFAASSTNSARPMAARDRRHHDQKGTARLFWNIRPAGSGRATRTAPPGGRVPDDSVVRPPSQHDARDAEGNHDHFAPAEGEQVMEADHPGEVRVQSSRSARRQTVSTTRRRSPFPPQRPG